MIQSKREMLDLDEVCQKLKASGFDDADILPDPTPDQAFKDRRIFAICPTRRKVDPVIVEAWNALLWPQNAVRKFKFARGWEVGHAYDALVRTILNSDFAEYPYILTLEDDNLPPPNGVNQLLETIESGPWDAVAGLYRTKDPRRVPLVLGDVETYRKTGKKDFGAIDITKIPPTQRVIEVLAVPMGFTIWRMDLFKTVPPPWCRTTQGMVNLGGGREVSIQEFERLWYSGKIDRTKRYSSPTFTQDVAFCSKAIDLGKRFAVDRAVDVKHRDMNTGVDY